MTLSRSLDRLALGTAAWTALAMLAACHPTTRAVAPPLPPQTTFGQLASGLFSVHRTNTRPPLTLVSREGDPAAAVGAAVFTEAGATLNTALAALMESRVRALGFNHIDVRPDADGYRLQGLVTSPEQAVALAHAIATAMTAEIHVGAPGLDAVVKKVELVRQRRFDSPVLSEISHCTGELAVAADEPPLDLRTAPGVAALESLRKSAHTVARTALSIVGPSRYGKAVEDTYNTLAHWELGQPPLDAWPSSDRVGVHAIVSQADATPTLSLAIRTRDPYAAALVADRAGASDSPLLTRLRNTSAWRLQRITATARPRGACLSFALERDRSQDPDSSVESDAARIAGLLIREIESDLIDTQADGSIAGVQVLRTPDPREAAALAAWWSLSSRLTTGPDRVAVALGLPPPQLAANDSSAQLEKRIGDSQSRFAADFQRARQAWATHVVESKVRVEAGQGELWVLAASPCGVYADTDRDAGVTALAAMAAAYSHDGLDRVSVEPWITADGVGVVAHATPQPGEGLHALATRVGDAAAQAIITRRIPERAQNAARARLLGVVDSPSGPLGSGFGALATLLSPIHPSWLAPLGLPEPIAKGSASIASYRWASLAAGPIRVAVLANVDKSQADAAVRAVDRWMFRRLDSSRSCPALASANEPQSTIRETTIRQAATSPRALIGIPVKGADAEVLVMLDLLAEGLDGTDGWLERALSSFPGASAITRVTGGSRVAALVIEVSASEANLEDAIRQVRATLHRLTQRAATAEHLARARARLSERDLARRLDPRRRLADLWARSSREPSTSIERWNTWMQSTLDASKVSTVRVLPVERVAVE